MLISAALVVASFAVAQPPAPPKFDIQNGDRIVWIGGTLVEREQRYGYWETALHAAFPDKRFTFRNLGWSGDTVWGESRGRFDFANAEKCFRQLVDQTLALKPTVIFVSYGTAESFEGEAGLPKFEKGLNKLLDALKPANARVVLFTPLPFEKADALPRPDWRNQSLDAYREVIRKTANARGAVFADLYSEVERSHPTVPRTENGMHLTDTGYRETSAVFLHALKRDVPDLDRSTLDPLRKTIVVKNELFFHRWRPENETYLFGFRKHEQGKNAKEVAEFDPLVAKAEEEIETLRKGLTK